MKETCDVLIVGVGGQGVILASNVLGEACLAEGRPVKAAETHGMAQRGGSVECHVRIGGTLGPLIPPGGADVILAFDLLEALRYRHYLAPKGTMVVNRHMVVPTSAFMQGLAVPTVEEALGKLQDLALCPLDADALALEAGSPLTQNIVMVGAGSSHLPISVESLKGAVKRSVPPKTLEVNLKAFQLGRDAAAGCR
ncbi:MAG: indolepyruvate ferredoxin oxidoreductase subunit beta [Methanomicrobiales archaeon]|nr:indolepyruvate ferredoxin oxidoreductase subunit beta [Methanomicrobiales archaeon]